MVFEWTDEEGDRCGLGEDGQLYILNNRVVEVDDHWLLAAAEVAESGLSEAVRQLNVYRKALEPVADAWCRGRPHELYVTYLTAEEQRALWDAARLMGLLPAAEDVPPEPTASAEEAFEGKSDQDTIDLIQTLKDALRASGKGAKE